MKKGLLFVLSGPSGSGKGTVLSKVLENRKMFLSISATSRGKRVGEMEGVNYYYLSRAEFERRIDEDGFFEYTETYGNYYGTPKQPIMEAMDSGEDIMLEIDTVGGINVKESFREAILIFIVPPTLDKLKGRLVNRQTETEEEIERRINYCTNEMNSAVAYDYLVINDNLEQAVQDILTIIDAEHLRVKNNLKTISKIKGGMVK